MPPSGENLISTVKSLRLRDCTDLTVASISPTHLFFVFFVFFALGSRPHSYTKATSNVLALDFLEQYLCKELGIGGLCKIGSYLIKHECRMRRLHL